MYARDMPCGGRAQCSVIACIGVGKKLCLCIFFWKRGWERKGLLRGSALIDSILFINTVLLVFPTGKHTSFLTLPYLTLLLLYFVVPISFVCREALASRQPPS